MRRAGKSYAVTSHASPVPRTSVPTTTVTRSVTVSLIMPGSRVCHSSLHIEGVGSMIDETMTTTGAATRPATTHMVNHPAAEEERFFTIARRGVSLVAGT